MSRFEGMNVLNVGDGALARQFDEALARLLADLADVGKDERAKRVIEAVVEFEPDGNGNLTLYVRCEAKLPKRKPWRSVAVVTRDEIHQLRNTEQELPFEVHAKRKEGEG